MLEFRKGFIKPNKTKIVTPLNIKSDVEKMKKTSSK